MPNHVYNVVRVTGSLDRLAEFVIAVTNDAKGEPEPFCFNKIIPQPEEILADMRAPLNFTRRGLPLWYVWRVENWCTKWNGYDQGFDYTNDALLYTFLTAWSPPTKIYEKLFDQFSDLRFNISYVDEDIPNNQGEILWDGESVLYTPKEGDIDFAHRVQAIVRLKGPESPI